MDEGFETTKKHTAQIPAYGPAMTNSGRGRIVTAIAALLVAAGIGFAGGMYYQKSSNGGMAGSGSTAFNSQMGPGGMAGRNIGLMGTVTAVSADSITVNDARPDGTNNSGATSATTLTISSATKVTDNGAAASISDIKTGDRVMIQTGSTDSKQASQITINPTMPAGGPGGQTTGANSTSGSSI